MKTLIALATVAVTLAAGCGGDKAPAPEESVRSVAEEFAVAIGTGDLETVCSLFSPTLEQEFSAPELGADCPDNKGPGSLGSPVFDGLTVAGVSVEGSEAAVTFEGSPVTLELVEVGGEWQITEIP